MEHTRRPVGEHGGGLAGDEDALDPLGSYAAAESTISVHEASFPARVAAFLRFSPVIEAAQAARRQEWPDGIYDIVTLALTAIDLVVSRQGFESEATRSDVVAALKLEALGARRREVSSAVTCPPRPPRPRNTWPLSRRNGATSSKNSKH